MGNYTSSEFEPSRCEAQGHMVTALLVNFKGNSLVTVISWNHDSLTALTCQQGLETFWCYHQIGSYWRKIYICSMVPHPDGDPDCHQEHHELFLCPSSNLSKNKEKKIHWNWSLTFLVSLKRNQPTNKATLVKTDRLFCATILYRIFKNHIHNTVDYTLVKN